MEEHKKPVNVFYSNPAVYQRRNEHNLAKDFENEIFGYEKLTKIFSRNDPPTLGDFLSELPKKSVELYEYWRSLF
jgi:hypothetical protein